jgi:lysylphosphatidylglycerol synthetase-like protein (DUF2156 family)
MKLQGVIVLASLFGPPILALLVFLRAGLPLLRSFINALYMFAVCVVILLGLFLLQRKLGMSEDDIAFVLPVAVVVCLGALMAPHLKHRSPANRDERDESPD